MSDLGSPCLLTSARRCCFCVPHVFRVRQTQNLVFLLCALCFLLTSAEGTPSCNLTLSSPNGTFTSPNYPSSYPPNTICSYVISLNEESLVQLAITDFQLSSGDYVVIYDGKEGQVELASYSMASGDLVYRPLHSSGHDMLVVFHSDISSQAKGFNITYTTQECPNQQLPSQKRRGQIQSAHYPMTTDQPTCYDWYIKSENVNDIIIISFEDIYLPPFNDTQCGDSYVEIGAKPSIQRFCQMRNRIPPVYISSTFHVWIKYKYLARRSGRGFSFQYIISPKTKSSGESCTTDEFACRSGGCVLWRWRCNGANECRDGSDEEGCTAIVPVTPPSPDYVCGAGQTKCLSKATGRPACFLNRRWCDGVADCADDSDEDPIKCKHICGQSSAARWGYLASPSFPNPYQAGARCEYHVVVQGSRKPLQLRFLHFDLPVQAADRDYLAVHDGDGREAVQIGFFTGLEAPPDVLESTTSKLFLLFSSDAEGAGSGFNISYQVKGECLVGQQACGAGEEDCFLPAQRCDGVWQCRAHGGDERGCQGCPDHKFSCSLPGGADTGQCYIERDRCSGKAQCQKKEDEHNCGEDRCRAENGTFLCHDKHCIYESWRCDGANDCQDGSDEINCPMSVSVKVVAAAVMGATICGWLLVVALMCACRLHTMRMRGARGCLPAQHGHQPRPQIQDEIYAQLSAPPLYDVAMATSRPYAEAERELHEAMAAAAAAAQQAAAQRQERPEGADDGEEHEADDEGSNVCLTETTAQWRRTSSNKSTSEESDEGKDEDEQEDGAMGTAEGNEDLMGALGGDESRLIHS